MSNLKQAPKLYHTGKKHDTIFYQLPQDLMDIIFTKIDGKSGNQIKLMCVLLGTQGNGSFGVSEKWICERTGMTQQTYSKARKALIEKGWLKLEDGKLFVLISDIYAQGTSSNCVLENKNKKIISDCGQDTFSESKAQSENVSKAHYEDVPKAHYEDVYNIKGINNKIEKNNKKEIEKDLVFPSEKPLVLGDSKMSNVKYVFNKPIKEEQVAAAKIQKQINKAANGEDDLHELLYFDVDEEELDNAKTFEERKKALGF